MYVCMYVLFNTKDQKAITKSTFFIWKHEMQWDAEKTP